MAQSSSSPSPRAQQGFGLATRIAALAAVFLIEKLFLTAFVDSARAQSAPGLGGVVRAAQHWGFRFAVAFFASVLILSYAGNGARRLAQADSELRQIGARFGWGAGHIALLLCLIPLTSMLYPAAPLGATRFAFIALLWVAIAVPALACAFLTLGRASAWFGAARALGVVWVYALVAAALGVAALQVSQQLWGPVASATFVLVRLFLAPFLPHLSADAATRILSTNRFAIQIADYCSGLEGMTLIFIFTSAWLLYFRHEYRFPRALLLLPAGVLTMFVLNAIRIAVLMLIGYVGYPDVAAYGFHSQAGWIAFNAVACGVAFISHRSRWLSHAPARASQEGPSENPTAAYLMPFLSILLAGVISRSMSGGFEALYPLRLIAAIAALLIFRNRFRRLNWHMSWRGLAVGCAVFAIWEALGFFLVPRSSMPLTLAGQSLGFKSVWISCRAIAAIVTVPLAEELAYRGYLMRRVMEADFEQLEFRFVKPFAVIVAAVVFGLSHGSMWVAGILAGLGFGFLLRRTGSMGEAVLAHATANALISIAVLAGGQWQMW